MKVRSNIQWSVVKQTENNNTPRRPGLGGFSLSNKVFYYFFFFHEASPPATFNLFLANKLRSFSPSVSPSKTDATSQKASTPPSSGVPCCASHRRPAVLRVVHKEGDNKGRQFYSCSLPRENKCNFFEVRRTVGVVPSGHVSCQPPELGDTMVAYVSTDCILVFCRERDLKNELTTPRFLCRSGQICTFPLVTMGNAA